MSLKGLLKRREKLKKHAHIIAGFVILIHAYEKFESGHGPYVIFTIAGLVFLSVAFFHSVIERRAPWIDGVFLFIEGVLSVIVAIDFFHMGKKALPYTYLALSLFQFFMAFRRSKKGMIAHYQKTHSVESISVESLAATEINPPSQTPEK